MMNREVNKIRAEIARLKAELKALETPKASKNTVWVLVREDRSLVQSLRFRSQFKQKAAATRLANKLMAGSYKGEKLVVMEYSVYVSHGYDKLTRTVRCAMTGREVEESINTPYCCSVASESYWCS